MIDLPPQRRPERPLPPHFIVPKGLRVAARPIDTGNPPWQPWIVPEELGFAKYELNDGGYYEFRHGMTVIKLHRRFVIDNRPKGHLPAKRMRANGS